MQVTLKLSGGLTSEEGSIKVVEIGPQPFTLGRSPGADWTILDPTCRVSGIHMELRLEGDALLLTDRSSGGTALGQPGARLQRDQPVVVGETAKLFLPVGQVDLTVERKAAAAPKAPPAASDDPFAPGSAASPQPPRTGAAPKPGGLSLRGGPAAPGPGGVSLGGGPRAASPLTPQTPPGPQRPSLTAGLTGSRSPSGPGLGTGGAGPKPSPRPAPPPAFRPVAPPPPAAGDAWLDDADDPFSERSESTFPTPEQPRFGGAEEPVSAPPDGDPFGAPAGEDAPADALDSTPPPFEPWADPETEPQNADESQPAPAPAPAPPRLGPGPAEPAAPEAAPARGGATQVHPARATPPPPAGTEAEAALAAMFAAMGLDIDDVPPGKRVERAREFGAVFLAMADALRRLLDSRRTVKRELGMAGTQIEFGANPLKFAPDAQAAADGLLRPLTSGYLSGEAAVSDALKSLTQHQVALVGGIKTAMRIALETFDPETLEKTLERRGLSQIVPALRKAELWDRFVEDYARVAEQADEDIRMVIGRELDRLYQPSSGGRGGAPRPRGDEPE